MTATAAVAIVSSAYTLCATAKAILDGNGNGTTPANSLPGHEWAGGNSI